MASHEVHTQSLRELESHTFLPLIIIYLVFTGCEMQNKYEVYNTLGQQIFFVQEGLLRLRVTMINKY